MFAAITKVFSAAKLLADALAMLAGTVNEIDGRLRAVALDVDSGPKVLEHANGQSVAALPADATPEPTNGRKSRSRAAAGE